MCRVVIANKLELLFRVINQTNLLPFVKSLD